MMKVKPCGTQLLIKLEEVKELSEGGIAMRTLTEQKREEAGQNMGRVLAFGPFVHADWEGFDSDKPVDKAKQWGYELGDLVFFSRYDGIMPNIPGYENHRLINSNCILGMAGE